VAEGALDGVRLGIVPRRHRGSANNGAAPRPPLRGQLTPGTVLNLPQSHGNSRSHSHYRIVNTAILEQVLRRARHTDLRSSGEIHQPERLISHTRTAPRQVGRGSNRDRRTGMHGRGRAGPFTAYK
jgi:hypothetical protein